jgi:hypothetical protein
MCGGKPVLFMAEMVIAPMVRVLEVVLPLIMPKKALAKILILAAPPRV